MKIQRFTQLKERKMKTIQSYSMTFGVLFCMCLVLTVSWSVMAVPGPALGKGKPGGDGDGFSDSWLIEAGGSDDPALAALFDTTDPRPWNPDAVPCNFAFMPFSIRVKKAE